MSFSSVNFLLKIGFVLGGLLLLTPAMAAESPNEIVLTDDPCQPSQAIFTFPGVMMGLISHGTMYVTNNSDSPFLIDPIVNSPVFSLGSYMVTLQPGETRPLNIRFEPLSGGFFETVLDLGNDLCADVLLQGTGLARSCITTPDFIDFGSILLGDAVSGEVTLTNDGDVDLPLSPSSHMPGLAVLGSDVELAPGESITYDLIYTAPGPGLYSGVIDWGAWYPTCMSVHVNVQVGINMEPGEDRLGIFFDEEFAEIQPDIGSPGQFVTGYLVLTNPSVATGVSAWECQVGLDPPGYILSWDLMGQAINAGQGNELIVGIGGPPIPYEQNVLLATFQLYVAEETVEPIGIRIIPVYPPSIPGTLAWIPGGEGAEPMPMLPFTGIETVAWVSANGLSPVPDFQISGRSVLLANVPNPFNPSTEIRYELGSEQTVRLQVYDLSGRMIRTLVDGHRQAGVHAEVWNGKDDSGRNAASGSYYVRLESSQGIDHCKVMLLK